MFTHVPPTSATTTAAVGGLLALLFLYQRGFHVSIFTSSSVTDMLVRLRAMTTSWVVNLSGTSSSLSKLPAVELLAPNVIRVLGLNPGRMTLQGTNTYIVGTGKRRALIDTGDGSSNYIGLLQATLKQHGVDGISDVLLTHGHFDHLGGCWALQQAFPDARFWKLLTYNQPSTIAEPGSTCECSAHVTNAFCLDQFHMHDLYPLCLSGEGVQVEGASIRAVATPGHTNDHVCFLLDDPSHGLAVFTGDCVLGEGTCTFQCLSEYMASLETLRQLKPARLFPGHGPVLANATAAIDMYISHRQQRENEILALLASVADATPSEIVAQLYPNLPFALTFPAKRNVQLHLNKLIVEKRVAATSRTRGGLFTASVYTLVPAAKAPSTTTTSSL
ncbi:Aste57867_10868 [Aphanomyces stellatus]|uniref:Aste57867_10868 protein n=1 Tax=Aphanomyces stellatus TaxID=120398 RepID=A0A485KS01_9STRA|nr:hypothetical protein As57867_010828 [Aphanomyces stellatus]VFT87736.1 Aste57867_10868 [Aphanomyces stellatus]